MITTHLRFANPPTAPGTYTTVRRGNVRPLSLFSVMTADGVPVTRAHADMVKVLPFRDITLADIADEHEPDVGHHTV